MPMSNDINPFTNADETARRHADANEAVLATVENLSSDSTMAAVSDVDKDSKYACRVPANVTVQEGDSVIVDTAAGGRPFVTAAVESDVAGSGGSSFEVIFDGSPPRGTTTDLASYPDSDNFAVIEWYDGLVYSFGGAGPTDGTYSYDPSTDSWTTLTSMPAARLGAAGAVYDGLLYAAGGEDGNFDATNDFYRYDPSTDSWTTLTSMPVVKTRASAVGHNGFVYVFAGEDNDTLRYDVSTDSWTTLTDHPDSDPSAESWGVAVLNDNVYVSIGTTIYEYDIPDDSWMEVSSLGTSNVSVVLVNGRVLAVGGNVFDSVFHVRLDHNHSKVQSEFYNGSDRRATTDGSVVYAFTESGFAKYEEPPVLHTMTEEGIIHVDDSVGLHILNRLGREDNATTSSGDYVQKALHAVSGDEIYYDSTEYVKLIKET